LAAATVPSLFRRFQLPQDGLERIEPGRQRVAVGIEGVLHEPQQRTVLVIGQVKVPHP
jgi:hypothetical protein